MDLLRFATAGSVDDGKSTLIGRLLHDTRSVLDDQLSAVERFGRERGDEYLNLAHLVDGLRAEREEGITIDVAYRYFATGRRKFIVADTPGHVRYTRNMVTGASTADVALVLADARKGIVEQTRRHLFVASLLRVPHVVLCVNKMDLTGGSAEVFAAIEAEFMALARHLDLPSVMAIPVSALSGENVVVPATHMDWYRGPTLLSFLESVQPGSRDGGQDFRLPVQMVLRPTSPRWPDYRAYAGLVAAGAVRVGDEVLALPSGRTSRVVGVEVGGVERAEARGGESVAVRLADELGVGRGDMLASPRRPPHVAQAVEALVCWMSERPLEPEARLLVKHTTRTVRAVVESLVYRLDVSSLEKDDTCSSLEMNEMGCLTLRTSEPLVFDCFADSRALGGFILIDERTSATVAAGMITRARGSS